MSSHSVILALGSNLASAPRVLEWTRRKLRSLFGTDCQFSRPVWTEPIDYPYPFPFLNQVVELKTDRPLIIVSSLLKTLEDGMRHRKSATEEGRVIVDIDLLAYDHEVLRPKDWDREYIQNGLHKLQGKHGKNL